MFVDRGRKNLFTGYGTLYLPVAGVQKILVNSEASLKTTSALHLPELHITVNGACTVAVSSLGKLCFSETEAFAFEHSIERREVQPAVSVSEGKTGLVHRR